MKHNQGTSRRGGRGRPGSTPKPVLGLKRGVLNMAVTSFPTFSRQPGTSPQGRHIEDSAVTSGYGLYSQCTAVLRSAHQQQVLLVPKNYPFFPSFPTPTLPVSVEQRI